MYPVAPVTRTERPYRCLLALRQDHRIDDVDHAVTRDDVGLRDMRGIHGDAAAFTAMAITSPLSPWPSAS